MRIIPVIDILNGVVVHAVRGERKEYKPLKSVLNMSVDPVQMAVTFENLGFKELYIADLDAITRAGANFAAIRRIAEKTRLNIMVDAGVSSLEEAEQVLRLGVEQVIIGTETLTSIEFVHEAANTFGPNRVVVSVDVKDGRVLRKFEVETLLTPVDVLMQLEKVGVVQVILLDLAKVGSEKGVDLPLLRKVLKNMSMKVFVGGGIRNISDLKVLDDMGVEGVLLATALHSGKINTKKIKQAGLNLT